MTRKEEVKQLKAEIERLNKRLKVLESLPEPIEEKELSSFDELRPLVRILYRGGIKTVEDLISSDSETLLKIRDIGPIRLKVICQWMKEQRLNFI